MKLGIRNKWSSPRRWAWWTVLPVSLLLAATAQAGDLPDPRIGPPVGTGVSLPEGVGAGMVGGPSKVPGADLRPEATIGDATPVAPPATGEGADPEPQPAGIPAPEPPPASTDGADRGAGPGGRLRPALEGSGAAAHVSDARMLLATQIQAVRATAIAAIDYLRTQLAGAIPRVDPPPPPTAPEPESPPGTIRGWTMAPATGTKDPAGGIKLGRGEPNPANGGARPAPEASTHQLTTHHNTAGTNRSRSERPVPPSGSSGLAAGLGSAAQILIPIGLIATLCGFAAPAFRRRLSPRAPWLRSALFASPLEQPG